MPGHRTGRPAPADLPVPRWRPARKRDGSTDHREARLVSASFARRIRPEHLRRRPGRAERSRLWRLGRHEDRGGRALGRGWPGREQSQDRELSRFPEGISGGELAERAREQACRFGAEILLLREGIRGEFHPGKGIGYLADGTKIIAHASICATGITYRRLNLPNEDRLLGAGVYYGAGASEAELCGQEQVVVVGGGNSAAQAALHFARYASNLTMVLREARLTENMSKYLADRIVAEPVSGAAAHRGRRTARRSRAARGHAA